MNRKKELLHDVKYGGMVRLLITYAMVGLLLIPMKMAVNIFISNDVAESINKMHSKIISMDTVYYLCYGMVMFMMLFVYAKTYIGRGKKLIRELERLGLIYSEVNRDYINGKEFGKISTIYNIGSRYTIIAYRNNVRVINNYKIVSARLEERVVQKIYGQDVKRDYLILETKKDIIEVDMQRQIIEAIIGEYKKQQCFNML